MRSRVVVKDRYAEPHAVHARMNGPAHPYSTPSTFEWRRRGGGRRGLIETSRDGVERSWAIPDGTREVCRIRRLGRCKRIFISNFQSR